MSARERELTESRQRCLLATPSTTAEDAMRTAILALLMCCAGSTISASPAAARDYPFCIQGCDFGGGAGDCIFTSYQQCLATASGRDATCAPNPYYNSASANAELQPNRIRQSRRRF
jgi:hypothetical protein